MKLCFQKDFQKFQIMSWCAVLSNSSSTVYLIDFPQIPFCCPLVNNLQWSLIIYILSRMLSSLNVTLSVPRQGFCKALVLRSGASGSCSRCCFSPTFQSVRCLSTSRSVWLPHNEFCLSDSFILILAMPQFAVSWSSSTLHFGNSMCRPFLPSYPASNPIFRRES